MDQSETLADEIARLSAHLDSATQRLLSCIRAFDETGDWHRQGAISCAHWLAWRLGLDPATAREKVRVARTLGRLPRIDEAFGRGELSYAKVRALTRIATPDIEERLLDLARNATGAQLERICRGYRQVVRAQGQDGSDLPPEDRSVWQRALPGGMIKIELVLAPDEAALVMKAIEKAQDVLRPAKRPDALADESASATAQAATIRAHAKPTLPSHADGVVHLAESFLSTDPGADTGRASEHYQVILHVDQDVLAPDGQLVASLDDGRRVSAEALRRIACDGGIVPVASGVAGDNHAGAAAGLDLGRRTRALSPALRRALWLRDRGCRFPGCPHTRFLHGHHIQHWLHGGPTRLDNLVLLCTHHHQLVHEGGFRIQPTSDGELGFHSPQGRHLPTVPAPPTVEDAVVALTTAAANRGLTLDANTNFPISTDWDGVVPDYDWAISGLFT